jgi:hypothetical protein
MIILLFGAKLVNYLTPGEIWGWAMIEMLIVDTTVLAIAASYIFN